MMRIGMIFFRQVRKNARHRRRWRGRRKGISLREIGLKSLHSQNEGNIKTNSFPPFEFRLPTWHWFVRTLMLTIIKKRLHPERM
jgi:hypothetical protein